MTFREESAAEVVPPWKARITRTRFLAAAGTALMGVATRRVFEASTASASPACCGPSPKCNCCNGSKCCSNNCVKNPTLCGPPYGYWICCDYSNFDRYGCYDWLENGNRCICAAILGPCT